MIPTYVLYKETCNIRTTILISLRVMLGLMRYLGSLSKSSSKNEQNQTRSLRLDSILSADIGYGKRNYLVNETSRTQPALQKENLCRLRRSQKRLTCTDSMWTLQRWKF